MSSALSTKIQDTCNQTDLSTEIQDTCKQTDKTNNELTAEKKDIIHQFRERIKSVLTPDKDNDAHLVKWLIAREYDLDKAEEMFRKHIQFLNANGLNNILENYTPNEVTNYFHSVFLGYDKDGSVVRILNIGACDIRGLCLGLSRADSFKFATYVLESDFLRQEKERANDKICDKHVYILDLNGLSWRTIVSRVVIQRAFQLLKNYELNYPERLKIAYFVNVPSFFSFIYSWLKTALPETIISKLEVLSPEQCPTVLAKHIDLSILPVSVGGTKTDSDGNPNCESLYKIPLGTSVPSHLMLSNNFEELNNDPKAIKVTVSYKSVFIAEKLITEPNSVLQWDFQTIDYDICIGLRYKPDENSEVEEIMPCHRVESHLIPESGSFTCERAGIYEIVFDNMYSWMTSKELTFRVQVIPPREINIEP